MEVEGQQVEMPTPDEELKLKHHFKKLRCQFHHQLQQHYRNDVIDFLKFINFMIVCWKVDSFKI